MTSRKSEYQSYLRSDDWKNLSLVARLRAGNSCELCGASGDHVHHVKYPKRFSEDNLDNLLVVCEYHHSLLHGIRGENMSGDLMLVEGVEIILDKDNVRWLDFEALFQKLWRAEDGSMLCGPVGYRESLNGAFAAIRDKWKKMETYLMPNGARNIRYRVTEQGAQQFAASYRHHKMEPFQDWLFDTVLPQIRDNGSYSMPKSTGNPIADLALNISEIAKATANAVLESEKASKMALEAKNDAMEASNRAIDADNKATSANEKVKELSSRLDDLTGGNIYETARMALQKQGIKPEKIYSGNKTMAMALGAWATKVGCVRGINSAPKLQEGSFQVNQYPPELLAEGIRALGIQPATMH